MSASLCSVQILPCKNKDVLFTINRSSFVRVCLRWKPQILSSTPKIFLIFSIYITLGVLIRNDGNRKYANAILAIEGELTWAFCRELIMNTESLIHTRVGLKLDKRLSSIHSDDQTNLITRPTEQRYTSSI